MYLCKSIHVKSLIIRKMEKWCDDNGSLLQNKVRNWFQSLMSKLLLHNREAIEAQFGKVLEYNSKL
jgi:hypothetical protein